jgi:hypothetical protein
VWESGKLKEKSPFMQCFGSGLDWIRNQAGKNNTKKEKVKKFPNKIFPRFRALKTWLWIRIQLESVLSGSGHGFSEYGSTKHSGLLPLCKGASF